MIHRSLLLTAVVTVTVPGVLGIFALLGHQHVSANSGVTAAALAGSGLTGPFPVAPATTRVGVRNDMAAVQNASGAPVTVLSRVTAGQQVMGMRLLDKAAAAGQATSYQGTERVSQSGVDGSVALTSQVWHQGGGPTMVQAVGAPTADGTRSGASAGTGSDSPEGVFGVTKSLVALLGKHYVAVYRGGGTAAGRAAAIVELYRFDG
ncbi:MAG TPA: hypothetical protein VHF26_20955, partial [Trebonia sp.]|nr:hypothetical protein [Trebonia sp.]